MFDHPRPAGDGYRLGMTTDDRTNGHVHEAAGGADLAPDDAEAALDALDAEPLDPEEAEAGAAEAGAEVDESLDERVEAVIEDLGGVTRRRDGALVVYEVGGRPFAVLGEERLEAVLDLTVLKAALRTPDTAASTRGAGWVTFTPATVDRYALDRAEAWVRFAFRRAGGR